MGKWKCVGPEGCCASWGLAGEADFVLVGSLSGSGCTTLGRAYMGPLSRSFNMASLHSMEWC